MDVASPELAKADPNKSDSKSDVRTVSSARETEDLEGPPTLDSEPPPSEPATSPKSPVLLSSSPAPHTTKMASAPPTPKSPSAPFPPKSSPAIANAITNAAKNALPASRGGDPPTLDGDPTDDSVTATAPRVPAPIIPLSAPRSVEIRTLDDDSADETEVKTLAADVGDLVRSARDQSRAEESDGSEADATDDSVTAQAPVHPAAPPDAKASPTVIRIGAKSLMPQSSGVPSTARDEPYDPDDEDSVTARSLAVGADFEDESVTTQSSNVPVNALPPPIDGETEGTTKRVRKKRAPVDANASEADERDDSVTAAAPGHLTNMLRVIASPSDSEQDEGDGDDDVHAHTQVMLGAPAKPPPGARSGVGPAARGEPSSESGLRVADEGPNHLGGDRASLGALGVSPNDRRHSAPMRAPTASDPAAMGPSPSDGLSRAPFPPPPMPPEVDRKPPYALLVGVVAAISVAIPVILYIVLSSSGADAAPRVTSQPSPDPVGLSAARPKASKPGPSAPAPNQQRPTNGSNGMNNGRPSPFRR